MAYRTPAVLKNFFAPKAKPTGAQFADFIDSVHMGIVNVDAFGAVGDGVTNDAAAFAAASSTGGVVAGTPGKTYQITSQVALTACTLWMRGTTVRRGYNTNEPAFLMSGAATDILEIYGGHWLDNSSSVNDFIEVNTAKRVVIRDARVTSNVIFADINDVDDIEIEQTLFEGRTTPTDAVLELNNNNSVQVDNNKFFSVFQCAKIEASSGSAFRASFSNNEVFNTTDTVVFMRALASSGFVRSEMVANGNVLVDIGKSGIKFTVPSGTSSTVENAAACGNVIRGYGLVTAGNAISVFKPTTQPGVIGRNVSVCGNSVDGRNSSGTVSSQTGDMAGISIRGFSNVACDGNSVRFVKEEGIELDTVTGYSLVGNVVDDACQSATGVAGIHLFDADNGVIDSVVRNTISSKSGLLLNRSQQNKVGGVYNNNGNYGVEESGGGGDPNWSNFNRYDFIAIGNTTGPAIYAGGPRSQEVRCIDANGPRDTAEEEIARLLSANMNSTADQAFTNIGPKRTKFRITRITADNASVSLTTAAGGIYDAVAKGGNVIVAAAQTYTQLTVSNKYRDLTLATFATTDKIGAATLYLSLTTAQGVAATADFRIYGVRLF